MKREPPAERELGEGIAAAFDALAAPDSRRLAAIEARLRDRAHRPRRVAWWWLFAALTAGGASALWWAGEQHEAAPTTTPAPMEQAPASADAHSAKPDATGAPAADERPVIYRRER